jgi:hypothetical protein
MTWKRNFAIAFALLLLVSLGASAAPAEEEKKIHVEIKKLHLNGGDHTAHFAWATDGQGEKAGHLGVALTALTPELKEHFLLPDSSGVMVSKVLEDSAALEAGLEVGDIISAVDGEAVSSPGELATLIRSHEGGETVVIEAWRDGKVLQLLTTLGESDNALHMAHRVMKWKAHGDGHDSNVVIDLDHDFNFSGDFDFDFDFGCEGENCTVLIDCDGDDEDDCECTVNGESADCPDLAKLHSLHR